AGSVRIGRSLPSWMVPPPGTLNWMVVGGANWLASVIAARSEPGPVSLVLVTVRVNVWAGAGPARARAARAAGSRRRVRAGRRNRRRAGDKVGGRMRQPPRGSPADRRPPV